ncbi:carboxyl-terminal-processing peptidase 1, chloroplastic [Dorcoceras hygrometricum]|uniref:Carboxyl-terminal-processing peptidase 1, chloroplastic n=1 Tax=Dorcoceras hygrometricum TaxID=472368 RepID=A0A2Z7BJI6_9LAMI|nr:carboxyl-terminal-processing peptidase 1, chloroplastic [Dorcoceras hygrometricum]
MHLLVFLRSSTCWFLAQDHLLNHSVKAKRCRIHLFKRHRFAIANFEYHLLVNSSFLLTPSLCLLIMLTSLLMSSLLIHRLILLTSSSLIQLLRFLSSADLAFLLVDDVTADVIIADPALALLYSTAEKAFAQLLIGMTSLLMSSSLIPDLALLAVVILLIRSTTEISIPSSVCTRKSDEYFTDEISSSRRTEQVRRRRKAAAAARRRRAATARRGGGREEWEKGGRRALGFWSVYCQCNPKASICITDSACKNQLVMVSVQYGPFNTNIPIRSTTIGKSRVARDPITVHISRRSNSDIACVTSIGYPRTKASGESSTTKHRLLDASGPHPTPPPDDPN